jgi:hypothetical protein
LSDLQKELEKAIRETLKDENGAGSDLDFCREIAREWLHVEGNLDVQHLASHVIETLGLDDYEYAMQCTNYGEVQPVGRIDWTTLERAQERLETYTGVWKLNGFAKHISAKLVKRRKAGKVEEV